MQNFAFEHPILPYYYLPNQAIYRSLIRVSTN
jgi:hypothetical protein